MDAYDVFLWCVLILWPFAILGLLFLMSRLERYERRVEAPNPKEAGLEPVRGSPTEREVKIVLGDKVVSRPEG
jgi:hypothetical protein